MILSFLSTVPSAPSLAELDELDTIEPTAIELAEIEQDKPDPTTIVYLYCPLCGQCLISDSAGQVPEHSCVLGDSYDRALPQDPEYGERLAVGFALLTACGDGDED